MSISANAVGPNCSRRADSNGSSGRGNGIRSITTSERVEPGTSIPWKSPAVANRHVSALSANAFTSAGLGRSRWVRIGNDTRPRSASAASSIDRQLVNRASVRPPAAVISASSSSWTAARKPSEFGFGRCSAQYSIECAA